VVSLTLAVLFKCANILHVHFYIRLFLHRQCSRRSLNLIRAEFRWEFDLEQDEHVAEFIGLFVEWQAFVRDGLKAFWRNYLTWVVLHAELLAVQVCDCEVDACESFVQRNFLLH